MKTYSTHKEWIDALLSRRTLALLRRLLPFACLAVLASVNLSLFVFGSHYAVNALAAVVCGVAAGWMLPK